jgi:hypothetical protein
MRYNKNEYNNDYMIYVIVYVVVIFNFELYANILLLIKEKGFNKLLVIYIQDGLFFRMRYIYLSYSSVKKLV